LLIGFIDGWYKVVISQDDRMGRPVTKRQYDHAHLCLCFGALMPVAHLAAQQLPPGVEELVVLGRWDNPVGMSASASQGVVGAEEIDARPRLRTGEILETVPGLIVTQHSGTGKSNQMFLRGFNLDHGTDFATWVDGMPVNMPTHGHGQGYTDLNFLIPELVDRLEYRKGAYYAGVSDFSSAGAAYLSTFRTLDEGFLKAGLGQDGYLRILAADSVATDSGEFLYGVQTHRYDGPWQDMREDLRRNNALLRYSSSGAAGEWNVDFMAYDAEWNSADQIPGRAVESGMISAFGSIDTDLVGETSRYSLSGGWRGDLVGSRARLNLYAIDYDLNLFSNFTYLLDDPVNGDQFEQLDERTIVGGGFALMYGGEPRASHTVGAMLRYDDIGDIGLFRTKARRRLSTVRRDSVEELSVGFYYSNEMQWTDKLRTIVGIQADRYYFDVDSDLDINSGSADELIFAPKANLIYAINDRVEVYVSAGKGFHSNDARGATITVDPASGDPAKRVSPLVDAHDFELGFRAFADNRLNVSAALWYLELDSELLFVGDAGNTEPSRASRRYGIEIPLYYRLNDRVTFDIELAVTDSEFSEDDPAGKEIPGSINSVLATGISVRNPGGFYGSLRARYFGPRPLIEDGSVESRSSIVVSGSVGFAEERFDLRLDMLNLFDSDDHDIAYYYASRLAGEPSQGIEDVHFHPIEPRTLRFYVNWAF
jgi:hypothetical protein